MKQVLIQHDERWALCVALILHAALASTFAIHTRDSGTPKLFERMAVNLVDETSLRSANSETAEDAGAAMAPNLADQIQEESFQDYEPAITERADKRITNPISESKIPENFLEETRGTPREATGSKVSDNFLEGVGSDQAIEDQRIPAEQIGRYARASLRQALNRQIKPHWNAPQGIDADQLVTVLAFRLKEDGSLVGRPRVVDQFGINASNNAQALLHAERAIRAVQLAAPFDLPLEYYNAWKNITEWRFDRRL